MSAPASAPVIDLSFPHEWEAEVLATRPIILPRRHFVYPHDAEEVERGALEVLVRPELPAEAFLATCALGFRDPAVPTGLWSTANPKEICAVSGGYAYLIDTAAPQRFTMLSFRPVLQVRVLAAEHLLLFVGHRALLAWGAGGLKWESANLSAEGITLTGIEPGVLHGLGWDLMADKDVPFALDLGTGLCVPAE
jgi:hypothetical protein